MNTSAAVPVMVVSNSLHHGGAERFTSRLIGGLHGGQVAVHLVLLRDEISYDRPEDISVDILGYQSAGDFPKAVFGLRRLVQQRSPAVILGTGTAVNTVIGLALKTLKQRPAWVARVDTNPSRRDLRIRHLILGRLYPLADAIVANSKGLKDALARFYPKQRHKISWVYNPVDFDRLDREAQAPLQWTIPADEPLLVTVGRAHSAKGWSFLIEVFEQLISSIPCQLVMCGDGPLLEDLKKRVGRMQLGKRIHLIGHCDNPFAILSRSDLFLLGSTAEGLPNALIEAQGLGCCAVSNRCDFGPDEIIVHGQTGLLVDCHNRSQWVAAMKKLLVDSAVRERMGAKAKKMVRNRFDARRRCRQWQDLVLRIAERKLGAHGALPDGR